MKPYPERPVILSTIKRADHNIHFLKASEFAFLGIYEQAADEFSVYRAGDYKDLEKLYTLATYYAKAKNPNRALFWAESLTKQIDRNLDMLLLPEGLSSLLYPKEYENIVDNFSKQRSVDKYFVLALIREESKFKKDAKSPQAARGLMQFIPSTARDLAAELGLEDFETDDLYTPELNINLGTQYLSSLMKNFQNNPFYVLSAYNSGEANTKRWKERCTTESPEEFIARIDYPETRNYVKKVMASFRTYRTINMITK
jgi:soluble lytic murein transglycosylase